MHQAIHPKLTAIIALLVASNTSFGAFTINLNFGSGISSGSGAESGFIAAATYWESQLADNVTINLDVDFTTLGAGTLGQASSESSVVSITAYVTALAADSTSRLDTTAIAGLPTLTASSNFGGLDQISFLTQTDTESNSSTVALDNDDSGNNVFLDINTANQKALGLFTGVPTDSDASITFNDAFTWDFDSSDGVDPGHQDFVGVAIHEIGHALGFTSGVDIVDFVIGNSRSADLDGFAIYSGLDLFRYSAPNDLDLSAGTATYLSLDNGNTAYVGDTNPANFSTGAFTGDGRQASHWKDNQGLGIFDPTARPAGQVNVVTQLDLDALDIIGWDLASSSIPEPSTLIFSFIGLSAFALRRKRS